MIELWDAYDNKFNRIPNIILVRGEPISDGAYHLVCEIIVKHTDNTYLLMRRDRKKHRGGMWELTAGGGSIERRASFDGSKSRIEGRNRNRKSNSKRNEKNCA